MLDDLRKIHDLDVYDALGVAEKQWLQAGYEYDLGSWRPSQEIRNIVHIGMGSSALWGHMSQGWPGWSVPFEVVESHDVPPYVGPNTLCIVSSYSGNTEEVLSVLRQAEKKGAAIVAITSGGQLEEIATQNGYVCIKLPAAISARYAYIYALKGLLALGESLGLIAVPGAAQEVVAAASFLRESIAQWLPTVPTSRNRAKQLAQEVMGRSAVLYAGPLLAPAAHKWKTGFNQNARNIAWAGALPEFAHSEFAGWTGQPEHKPYVVFCLVSSFDDERIKKQFELSAKLLSGRWPAPERVEAKGSSKIQQLLWATVLGDFVSLYTALLNGVSPMAPAEKDSTERFKKELHA